MQTAPRLILLGLRGSGKTTLGRRLAQVLAVPFLDLDDLTPRLAGAASAADLLRSQGEPAFRAAECRALHHPDAHRAGVLALGGGTPTHDPSAAQIRQLQEHGSLLIYLRATANTLAARLAPTDLASRPALLGPDPLSEIAPLLKKRDALYCALADQTLEVDLLTEDQTVAAVLALLAHEPP